MEPQEPANPLLWKNAAGSLKNCSKMRCAAANRSTRARNCCWRSASGSRPRATFTTAFLRASSFSCWCVRNAACVAVNAAETNCWFCPRSSNRKPSTRPSCSRTRRSKSMNQSSRLCATGELSNPISSEPTPPTERDHGDQALRPACSTSSKVGCGRGWRDCSSKRVIECYKGRYHTHARPGRLTPNP